jgi:hypothetical protein
MTFYFIVIRIAPTAIRSAPKADLYVSFSAKKRTLKIKTKITLNLSSAATPEAGPYFNARK